jgi:hypothetical protein
MFYYNLYKVINLKVKHNKELNQQLRDKINSINMKNYNFKNNKMK